MSLAIKIAFAVPADGSPYTVYVVEAANSNPLQMTSAVVVNSGTEAFTIDCQTPAGASTIPGGTTAAPNPGNSVPLIGGPIDVRNITVSATEGGLAVGRLVLSTGETSPGLTIKTISPARIEFL